MVGRFVIWVEDTAGNVVRAFTHVGKASEGIARAKREAHEMRLPICDVWATPVQYDNNNWSI